LPTYSDTTLDKYEQIINITAIKGFSSNSILDEMDTIVRFHLYEINQIERAVGSLSKSVNKFNGLSTFSLCLAIFFDFASLLAGLFVWILTKKKR